MSQFSASGKAWDAQRLRVLNRDEWTCTKCQKDLVGDDATVDHILPIKLNPHKEYDDLDLVAMCRSCNGRKKDNVLTRLDYRSPDWFGVSGNTRSENTAQVHP